MYMVVLVTTKDMKEAGRIAEGLVAEKLCACVNIVKGVRSVFMWKGKLEKATECLMVIKTKKSMMKKLQAFVSERHSYEVPEIIGIPLEAGNPGYLRWIDACLR